MKPQAENSPEIQLIVQLFMHDISTVQNEVNYQPACSNMWIIHMEDQVKDFD